MTSPPGPQNEVHQVRKKSIHLYIEEKKNMIRNNMLRNYYHGQQHNQWTHVCNRVQNMALRGNEVSVKWHQFGLRTWIWIPRWRYNWSKWWEASASTRTQHTIKEQNNLLSKGINLMGWSGPRRTPSRSDSLQNEYKTEVWTEHSWSMNFCYLTEHIHL